MLNSKNIAIVFGISGGIGGNIYNQLKKKGYSVYGVSRTTNANSNIISEKYLKDFSKKFIKQNIKIKIFINTIGFLHDKSFSPEKKQQDINYEYMKKCFEVNTIPTALMIKYFCPLMIKKEKSIFASISARVGSISDNYLGGWYSYRASKAAVNNIMVSISQEFKSKYITVSSFHPGWVRTDMGGPNATLSAKESASSLIKSFENLTFEDTGKFFNYDGNEMNF